MIRAGFATNVAIAAENDHSSTVPPDRRLLPARLGLDGVTDRLAYTETVEADVNRYADLATAGVPPDSPQSKRKRRAACRWAEITASVSPTSTAR